jgi:HAD superfamily hydrolase (TIGR01509 family)
VTAVRAAIFDVDGVLVDSPHEKAWREALRELLEGDWRDLRERTTWSPGAFTPLVYQREVSGKARRAGALAALRHFGVPDADALADAYGARKQAVLERLIDAADFAAYPDALRFVAAVKEAGLLLAAASSSKNASGFLRRIPVGDGSLLDVFDVDVSGRDFAHGKPHPEMFLTAAAERGVEPAAALVVEDAVAGVTAAKAGGMLAVGVARHDDTDLLTAAGADVVVTSLDDLDLGELLNVPSERRRRGPTRR